MDDKTFNRLVDETFSYMKEILAAKNADYTNGNPDRLSNFKIIETAGIASAKQGLMCRLMDKIGRLTTFVQRGKLSVRDESAIDACHDLIGYAVLLKALIMEDVRNANRPTYQPRINLSVCNCAADRPKGLVGGEELECA